MIKRKMKKFLNISLLSILALASLSLTSCKNEVEDIFEDDAVIRLDNKKAEYVQILTDTEKGNRWQMEYFSNTEEPGYIYLMTFYKDGSVKISGSNKWINYVQSGQRTKPAFGSAMSMWDVIADNGPVLSFNTYNPYFHLFADPYDIPSSGSAASDRDINETGYGHEGDYEFDIMNYSGDTLYLVGKKYELSMIMTRVKEKEKEDEAYMNEVVALADSFFNAKVPSVFINLPNGVRYIVKDGATSILKMYREGTDEISTSETHNVIITHDGLSFMDPITLDATPLVEQDGIYVPDPSAERVSYTVKNFIRQPDGSLLCRDDNQTTMTADHLAGIYTNQSLVWRSDLKNVGGLFADLATRIADDLKAYNKSTFQYVQVSYDLTLQQYTLVFNVKKGSVKYNPTFYMTLKSANDNQVTFSVAPEGDRYGETYATNCPSIREFANVMNQTLTLSTNSLLAPTVMTTSVGAGDYVSWNLQ